MKSKQFGKGGPDVSVIGPGTWYLDRGDRLFAVAAIEIPGALPDHGDIGTTLAELF